MGDGRGCVQNQNYRHAKFWEKWVRRSKSSFFLGNQRNCLLGCCASFCARYPPFSRAQTGIGGFGRIARITFRIEGLSRSLAMPRSAANQSFQKPESSASANSATRALLIIKHLQQLSSLQTSRLYPIFVSRNFRV